MEISGIDDEITIKTPPNVVKRVKKMREKDGGGVATPKKTKLFAPRLLKRKQKAGKKKASSTPSDKATRKQDSKKTGKSKLALKKKSLKLNKNLKKESKV